VEVWPARENFILGKHNVKNASFVNPDKMFVPPLNIKAGVYEVLWESAGNTCEDFPFLHRKFQNISDYEIYF
jgi:hypothetical protein